MKERLENVSINQSMAGDTTWPTMFLAYFFLAYHFKFPIDKDKDFSVILKLESTVSNCILSLTL